MWVLSSLALAYYLYLGMLAVRISIKFHHVVILGMPPKIKQEYF